MAYFDMFNYPLSEREIRLFLPGDASGVAITRPLQQLVLKGRIFYIDKFYSLHDDPLLAKKRSIGNQRAETDLYAAYRISKFLFKFPFVRGISISGSLSKGFADRHSDIDYFIITAQGKLWIARTLLHLFKKLSYLYGAQHRYCMNYFLDEQALEIEEKNLFTAVETVTLLPMCGNGAQKEFFASNTWVQHYLPNCRFASDDSYYTGGSLKIKKGIEALFNNRIGDQLDSFFMKITAGRWDKKERKHELNTKGNRMGIICKKHCCKPNPAYFQVEILRKYHERISELKSSNIGEYYAD
ncbi:MAG: hypothetical protein EPN39_01155 [Chitinophagaceae bacterium]|nr:MAG: hypothetical protein EPN39_01155 [Chitinophagaceae bacterium]